MVFISKNSRLNSFPAIKILNLALGDFKKCTFMAWYLGYVTLSKEQQEASLILLKAEPGLILKGFFQRIKSEGMRI